MTRKSRPDANAYSSLPVQEFVDAFVAALVAHGWTRIAPREPNARAAFMKIVELFDRIADVLAESGASSKEIWPWVQLANRLRLDPTGGAESWEQELLAAQDRYTRMANPTYEIVDFRIDPYAAKSELEALPPRQRALIEEAVRIFDAGFAARKREPYTAPRRQSA